MVRINETQGDEISLSSLLNQLVSPAKSTASSRYTDFRLPFDVSSILALDLHLHPRTIHCRTKHIFLIPETVAVVGGRQQRRFNGQVRRAGCFHSQSGCLHPENSALKRLNYVGDRFAIF